MAEKNRRNERIPARSFIIILIFIAGWMVIIGALTYYQIFHYDQYRAKVIDNVQTETTVSATRGTIYDRNMNSLATNATVWRVFISPRDITDEEQKQIIAQGLSQLLEVDYSAVIEKANKVNRADETIKKNIDEDAYAALNAFIAENDLDSQIHLEASTKRYYPYGSLASQVIGFVGTDGGLLGLEMQYNTELTGTPGRYITARSGSGKRMPFKYDSYIDAVNGANLVTTIDLNVQYLLEAQLESTYNDSDPLNRVTGIVMDVNTGGILAMGTYPDFDLNDPYTLDENSQSKLDSSGYTYDSDEYNEYYWDLLYSLWKNKAVSELYEPGSTFKIITTSMALEENLVSFDEQFTCTGTFFVDGYSKAIHCHKLVGHGTHPFSYMLQQSCNPTLMTVAARIGRAKFYEYFQEFGYTEKTGVDLPGEASSIYHSYSGFNQVELAVYSFGQTFKVTALQQLTAICAVANGGNLVTPHDVSALVDADGNVLKSSDTEVKRKVISTEVCAEIAK
ncbi:MAG: penicillin-binding transpeptidase domain-containing protein, partial [Eubacteriales bacterium]